MLPIAHGQPLTGATPVRIERIKGFYLARDGLGIRAFQPFAPTSDGHTGPGIPGSAWACEKPGFYSYKSGFLPQ